MNRNNSFSPQNSFHRSPGGFQNHFRLQQNQQFPPQYNQNFQQRMQFRSPHSSPGFRNGSNYHDHAGFPSPQRHSSPKVYSPRNRSPYMNNRNSSNGSWNNQSNMSTGSSRNSSAYFADTSGSPYSVPNRDQRFQAKRNRFSQNDSNPGHSTNIEDYIHPSMLEDPWKKGMAEYERKKNLSRVNEKSGNS